MDIEERLRRGLLMRRSEVVLPNLPSPEVLKRIRARRLMLTAGAFALSLVLVATGSAVWSSLVTRQEQVVVGPVEKDEGIWSSIESAPLSSSHLRARSFWTGDSLLVVSGGSSSETDPRGVEIATYDLESRMWKRAASSPLGWRSEFSAVWTGEEVIVWGGSGEGGSRNDGASYDPLSDQWTVLSASPLRGRTGHAALWTGSRMIVQGGSPGSGLFNDGAAYDPITDSWASIAPAPGGGRSRAAIAWTGSQMIIWGGVGSEGLPSDGLLYDPDDDVWTSTQKAPIAGRVEAAGLWSGETFLVWGGSSLRDDGQATFVDGATYDPATDSWRKLSSPPLDSRQQFAYTWTGSHALFWGGTSQPLFGSRGAPAWKNGALYEPDADSWTPLPASPLERRYGSMAVWTGREVIVWGGCCTDDSSLNNFVDGATLTFTN